MQHRRQLKKKKEEKEQQKKLVKIAAPIKDIRPEELSNLDCKVS